MDKKLRWALIALLAVVLAGVVGYIVYRDIDRAAGVQTYAEAEALAGVPDLAALVPAADPAPAGSTPAGEGPAPSQEAPEPAGTQAPEPAPVWDPALYFRALEDVDLEVLRSYNQEVLGWIAIPGVLSYPLMRGEDNSFYLNHTWKGTSSAVGAVFMDYRCSADLGDFNTLIYSHRTRGNAMFGSLSQYAAQAFWDTHPDVFLVTDAGISRYRIYAAYEAELTAPAYYNQVSTQEGREEFIRSGTGQSGIVPDVTPGPEDSFITLSTCTASGSSTRWVVQAVLMGE